MINRRPSSPLFGMSFLDVLFCALGGAVMLLFYTMVFDREQLRLQVEKTVAVEMELAGELQKLEQRENELLLRAEKIEELEEELAINIAQSELTLALLTQENETLRFTLEAEIARLEKLLGQANVALTEANRQHEIMSAALGEEIEDRDRQLLAMQTKIDEARDDLKLTMQELRQSETRQRDLERELAQQKRLAIGYQQDRELGRDRENKLRYELLIRDKRLQEEWALRLKSEQLALTREKELDELNIRIDSTQAELASMITDQRNLRALIDGAIGLNGSMKHVVFVFDTSESLGDGEGADERFAAYKDLLKAWIRTLPMESFSIVRYSTTYETPEDWEAGLVVADEVHRLEASEFIDGFTPKGRTRTLDAMQFATELPDVDTIVLFSDGEPTDENGNKDQSGALIEEVLDFFRDRRGDDTPEVTVNCVAMGNYLNERYGQFLRDLAQENGGVFIGR